MRGFQDAVQVILKHEGGYVNHPNDRGGATNWGITQKVYETFKGRPVTINEMKNMPKSDAVAIYKKEYWDRVGGDSLNYYATALTLFDQAVNRGVAAVIRQAQGVVGLTQDGRMGPKTLAALNAMPDTRFIPAFLKAAEQSYRTIVERNPTQAVFLNGWMNRVKHLSAQAQRHFGELTTKQVAGIGVGLIAALGAAVIIALKMRK